MNTSNETNIQLEIESNPSSQNQENIKETEEPVIKSINENIKPSKRSPTIELSCQESSEDINSIFYSNSFSNDSSINQDSKDYFKICKELNDSAVEHIKEGIRLQEGEEDSEESEGEVDEEDKMNMVFNLFNKAKAYLTAAIKHVNNHCESFSDVFLISIYYNMAWVNQKISDLEEWGYYLDLVLELIEKQSTNNEISEFNKMRYWAKFQLQQWAIKSQTDDHLKALDHGKFSVKNCHNLIFQTYKLWRRKINSERMKLDVNKKRMSFKPKKIREDSFNNEYSSKDVYKGNINNLEDSKYFTKEKNRSRNRRWFSQENSRNNSVNLSTK